jgi:2-methylisocitrate lyase-like PEP mutase family enzyme/transposase
MLKPQPLGPIPEETLNLGHTLLDEDNLYRKIGDEYAELIKDEDFASMYSNTGQAAYSPARLSLVTVLRAMEHLSDRVALRMVRTRIDWKYALHLPLEDDGFDASVLSEFRSRLVNNQAERKFFDALLEKLKEIRNAQRTRLTTHRCLDDRGRDTRAESSRTGDGDDASGDRLAGEVRSEVGEAATDLPVNADFEAGFADQPEGVAANVSLAVETGVAGLSIEDRTGKELYPLPLAIARIRAAREAISKSGHDVLLIGRTEGLLIGKTNLDEAIERLVAYSDAGADVLYAPDAKELADIKAIVDAVAPEPVNVLLLGSDMNIADLAAAGVRRIRVGSAFARAAWAGFEEAARSVRDEGRLPAAKG